MNDFRCYTREELRGFLLGNISALVSVEIAEHVDQCDICEDTIVGMENTSDDLLHLLQRSQRKSSNAEKPVYDNNPDFRNAMLASQDVIHDWNPNREPSNEPTQIGDYEIVSTLARGGMGSVFKARHLHLQKEVAIKILPERKMGSRDAIARFSREMKIIGQMSHPSMVSATDAGADQGIHYLVMELVDGVDLGKTVRRCGRVGVADASEIVRQAAIGIQYAHNQGVIHRDVKPSNLMLANDPLANQTVVKVLDLGLATLGGLTGTVDELTTVGQLMGTLDYMAPEQCGGTEEVDARADIYGLGATLYKLLTGVAPYSCPENDTPLKKLKSMAISEPTPIRQRLVEVPDALVEIIDRCLAREPAQRFTIATELAEALEPMCEGSDLSGLLQQTRENTSDSKSESMADADLNSVLKMTNTRPANSKSRSQRVGKPNQANQRSSNGWIGNFVKFIVALAIIGLTAAAGIVIYINTSTGQLIIESEVDGVEVTVLKNETPTKDLQIEHGSEVTRLRAGEYQVVIKGDSDGLVIDGDHFILKRGEIIVARITKRTIESLDGTTIAKGNDPGSDNSGPDIQTADSLNLFEKRLYELKMLKSGDYHEVPADHPGMIELDKLIAETQELLNQGIAQEDYFAKELFQKREHRFSYAIAGTMEEHVKILDREIEALEEFIRNRKPNVASGRKGSSPENPNRGASVQHRTVEMPEPSDKPFSIGPTYMGRDIVASINLTLSAPIEASYQPANYVKILQQQLTPSQKREVAEHFIQKYKNELAVQFQTRLIGILSTMCESENVMELVLDHAVSVASRLDLKQLDSYAVKAFESLWRIDSDAVVNQMVDLARSEKPNQRALAVAFAMWLDRVEAQQIKLDSNWIEPLTRILESDDMSTRASASYILARQFPNSPAVLAALNSAVKNDSSGEILARCFGLLLEKNPKDQQLPKQLSELVDKGLVLPFQLVYEAVVRSQNSDDRLLNEIVSRLSANTWAMTPSQERSQVVNAGGGVSSMILNRQQIIRAIGDFPEFKTQFVPVLQKQFELDFSTTGSVLRDAMLKGTNDSLARLLDVDREELHEGRDVEQWFQRFLNSNSNETRRRSLQGMTKLQMNAENPNDIVLTVVPKLRDISFVDVDLDDENSLAKAAIDFCIPVRLRVLVRTGQNSSRYDNTLRKIFYNAFLENLDALEDQDAMYALWILRNQARNDSPPKRLLAFVRRYLESENPDLSRRALTVLIQMYVRNSNSLVDEISKAFESEAFNDDMKIAVLQFAGRYDSGYASLVASDHIGQPVLDFLASVDDPRQIATILSFAEPCGPGLIEPFLVRLIAENKEYLHEVHQPILLDLWNGKRLEPDATENDWFTETLFDNILTMVDKGTERQKNPIMLPRRDGRDPKTALLLEDVIAKLEEQTPELEGAQKRRLERILKKINPKE